MLDTLCFFSLLGRVKESPRNVLTLICICQRSHQTQSGKNLFYFKIQTTLRFLDSWLLLCCVCFPINIPLSLKVVFRGGEGALQVLPPLIDVLPEARLNLVIYYLKQGQYMC